MQFAIQFSDYESYHFVRLAVLHNRVWNNMDTTSIPTHLTYQNILSNFFVDGKLISARKERIENGFEFVVSNVPNRDLSTHKQNIIRKKVASFEVSFYKKWRGSRCKSMAEFQQLHEKWIHMDLQVTRSPMNFSFKVLSIMTSVDN